MRVNTKQHLPRRTFLRGVGVSMALPLLDSMIPANTLLANTAANPQLRLGFCYMPHGAVMSTWTPVMDGAGYTLSRTLAPLKSVQDSVLVLTGLGHRNAGSLGPGDSGGDHGRGPSVFLNASHPKRTEGEDVRAGKTIDQIAAEKIGQDTPLPSLELATEDMTGLIGACDVGFSCTYTNTISWKTDTTPLPMEINPRNVFDRLFGDGGTAADRVARIQREHSILDAISAQVSHLQRGLPSNDRNRVAEYLDNVR